MEPLYSPVRTKDLEAWLKGLPSLDLQASQKSRQWVVGVQEIRGAQGFGPVWVGDMQAQITLEVIAWWTFPGCENFTSDGMLVPNRATAALIGLVSFGHRGTMVTIEPVDENAELIVAMLFEEINNLSEIGE